MSLLTAVVAVLDSAGTDVVTPRADGTKPLVKVQMGPGLAATYALTGDTGIVTIKIDPATAGALNSITVPDPALGSPSITDGEERRTSRRLTTTNGTQATFLSLPFVDPGHGTVRVDLSAFDAAASTVISFAIFDGICGVTGTTLFPVDGAASPGGCATPSVANFIGHGSGVALAWAAGVLSVKVTGPGVYVIGTADITAGGLYGGGTLDTLTLRMNVDGGGASTLTFSGAGNTVNEAALLAAIHTKWPTVTATQGGPSGNKLVLDGSATGSIVIVSSGSTALTALGLTAGTYTPESVQWIGAMRICGGT